jgi:hypothetical protein
VKHILYLIKHNLSYNFVYYCHFFYINLILLTNLETMNYNYRITL